jgi:lysophospholipid acyltransferase (LPLAT)-like uncharacterized protein
MVSIEASDIRGAPGRADIGTEELLRRVYRFNDLSGYSLGGRLKIRAIDLVLYLLINAVCRSLRWEVRGAEHLESVFETGHRAIFTFWHTCIFSATWFWRRRGIVVMSSRSKDGESLSRLIRRFGYGAARGSSSRGASRALAEMARCLEHGIDTAFTIDGPRGPALVAKTGAVTLARHTGQAILPFHVTARKFITLPSWDRLQVPIPFTKAITLVGPPIYVSQESSGDEVQRQQSLLQSTLEDLCRQGQQWRTGEK